MEGFSGRGSSRWSPSSFGGTTLETELTDELERLRWRRRESNPRSEQLAEDSEEDPDLAAVDAGETASEPPHKQAEPGSPPFIDPGQLSVFDFLDGSNDA